MDRRAKDAEDVISKKTGLVLSPHYGASKLRWCLDCLPAVRDARANGYLACGPLASFLSSRLTESEALVDPANASRTSLFNLDTADWDPELLSLFGIPAAVLPHCVNSRHDFGRIKTMHGLIPLTVITGDQSAALFGFGEPLTDAAYINLGTGAFVQRPMAIRSPPSRLLCSLAYDDGVARRFALEGTVNGAGSALAWACAHLDTSEAEAVASLPQWLSQELSPPLFINGVSGLGSPYWRAMLTSRFVGEGSAAAKLVSVIESIVFLIQDNLAEMNRITGQSMRHIIVSGGLSRLDGLCQRLANLSGATVQRPPALEATARGVAFLTAGSAQTFPPTDNGTAFDPADDHALTARYHRWRAELERSLALIE